MKFLILLFMQLYCKLGLNKSGNNAAVWDHRNYGHGFLIGTIGWGVVFITIAHLLNYQNWVFLGFAIATISAFIVAVIWELIQDKHPNKRFSWRDVWASNFWFIPLMIIGQFSNILLRIVWNKAEQSFLEWWSAKGKYW